MNTLKTRIGSFLEAFADAYKYAELDFYKLRGEILTLLNRARSKGYENPDYCELTITIASRIETDVTISAFYKSSDGKFYRFKRALDLGRLVNIPHIVNERLKKGEPVSIRISDFQSLYAISENDINPSGDFNKIQIFTFKDVTVSPKRKEISIKDELFYYVVNCTYIYEDRRDTRTKYYGTLRNLPDDIIQKISTSENHECSVEITEE